MHGGYNVKLRILFPNYTICKFILVLNVVFTVHFLVVYLFINSKTTD
jgi:hypothetical protein